MNKIDFIIDYNDESILVKYIRELKVGEYNTIDKLGNVIRVAVSIYGSRPESPEQIALITDQDDNVWEIIKVND